MNILLKSFLQSLSIVAASILYFICMFSITGILAQGFQDLSNIKFAFIPIFLAVWYILYLYNKIR